MAVLVRDGSFPRLHFLTGADKPLNTCGWREHLFVLIPSADVNLVRDDLTALLRWSERNAARLDKVDFLNPVDNVSDALERSFATADPVEDLDEVGQGLAYLFGCIKMIREICDYALQHRLCVLHYINQDCRANSTVRRPSDM